MLHLGAVSVLIPTLLGFDYIDMSLLEQYIAVVGGFQGCLLFGLLVFDYRVSSASKILGVWCLFFALSFLFPFIIYFDQLRVFDPTIGWILYLPSCYGALLYLYFRNSILGTSLTLKDVLYFAPLIVCYALNVNLLFSSGHEFRAWFEGTRSTTWVQQVSQYILFAQAYVYAFITALLIKRYQRQARNTLSTYNPLIFKWFWGAIVFNVVIWSLKTIASFTRVDSWVLYASDILIVVFIYFVAMVQWRHPRLFTISRLADSTRSIEIEGANSWSSTNKMSEGALDVDTRATLFDVVKQQVEKQALYRNNELTLAGLADTTGLSSHHLSEVLNQHEGKNFYQFINAYRVADVCKQLKQGNSKKVMDIAMSAGFSSKSTFNSIFKQITGLTPTQYRQNLISDKS